MKIMTSITFPSIYIFLSFYFQYKISFLSIFPLNIFILEKCTFSFPIHSMETQIFNWRVSIFIQVNERKHKQCEFWSIAFQLPARIQVVCDGV